MSKLKTIWKRNEEQNKIFYVAKQNVLFCFSFRFASKTKSKPMFLTQASHSQPASQPPATNLQPPATNHPDPTTPACHPRGGECFLLANGPFWGVLAPITGWGAPFLHKISTVLRRTWPQKGTPKSSSRCTLTRCTVVFWPCEKKHHENIGA